MDEVSALKEAIKRKAIKWHTGGFRPENSKTESWIGKVFLYKEDETLPSDSKGKPMLPVTGQWRLGGDFY